MPIQQLKCLLIGAPGAGVSALSQCLAGSSYLLLNPDYSENRKKKYPLLELEMVYSPLQTTPLLVKHVFTSHLQVNMIVIVIDLAASAPSVDAQLAVFQQCIEEWKKRRIPMVLVGQKQDAVHNYYALSTRYRQLVDYAHFAKIRLANPPMVSAKTGHGIDPLENDLLSLLDRSR